MRYQRKRHTLHRVLRIPALSLFCLSTALHAAEPAFDMGEDEVATPTDGTPETSVFDIMNAPHRAITEGFESSVRYIDVFFAEEKIYEESTESYARLSGSVILDEFGDLHYAGELRIKLDLPKTKEKLKLLFESDANAELDRGEQPLYDSPKQAAEATKYYASVQSTLKQTDKWDIHNSIGIRLDTPLDPFMRVRLIYKNKFDKWEYRFAETLFWFDSDGTGHTTLFEFDRPLNETWLFRTTTAGTWRDTTDYYDLSQDLTLFQTLSERRVISYQMSVFGRSQPAIYATEYRYTVRYRQKIHKDWLFAEVAPQLSYLKENGFNASPSLTLKLEMIFGSKYL